MTGEAAGFTAVGCVVLGVVAGVAFLGEIGFAVVDGDFFAPPRTDLDLASASASFRA